MNLKPIGSNQTELTTKVNGFRGDTKILFSYETPVAAMNLSPEWHEEFGSACVRTEKRWSVTTSRHINAWLAGARAVERDQAWFNTLADVA